MLAHVRCNLDLSVLDIYSTVSCSLNKGWIFSDKFCCLSSNIKRHLSIMDKVQEVYMRTLVVYAKMVLWLYIYIYIYLGDHDYKTTYLRKRFRTYNEIYSEVFIV